MESSGVVGVEVYRSEERVESEVVEREEASEERCESTVSL
jgi:hypothetical protein